MQGVIIQHRRHYTSDPVLPCTTLTITHHIFVNRFQTSLCLLKCHLFAGGKRIKARIISSLCSGIAVPPRRLIPEILLKGPCLCAEPTAERRLFRLKCQRKHARRRRLMSCVTGTRRWAVTDSERFTLQLLDFCASNISLILF